MRVPQVVAVVLVVLAISPITAPFCTCDLTDLSGPGPAGAALKVDKPSCKSAASIAMPVQPTASEGVGRPLRTIVPCQRLVAPAFLHSVLRL